MSASNSIMVYISQRQGSKPIMYAIDSIYPITLKALVPFGTGIDQVLRGKKLPFFGHVFLNGKKVTTRYMLTERDINFGNISIEIHSDITLYSPDQKQNLDTEVNKLIAEVKELFEQNLHLKDKLKLESDYVRVLQNELKIESGYNRILRQEIARYRAWRPGLATGLFNTTVRIVSKLTGRPCK